MRISQIIIDNFRSIHRQRIRIDKVNILLGENDVGKSNVLHALNLFFNTTKRANFTDVHSDVVSNLLSITVIFEFDNVEQVPRKLRDYLVGNELIVQRKHKVNRAPLYFINKKKLPDTRELRRFFKDKFIYIPTVRDAGQHEKTLDLIHELIDNPSKHIGESVSKEANRAISRLDRYMSKYLRFFAELMSKNLKIKDVKITFAPDIEEILKLAKIRFGKKEHIGRLQSRGQGIQSLTLINLYRSIATNSNSFRIIALEEPEAHLHPNLIRSFAQDLFAKHSNTQIILTTHSPIIVDQAKLNNIIRVVSENSKTRFIKPNKINSSIERCFYKYLHARHSDIFFAKHVLLVEGMSDKHFLTTVSPKIILNKNRKKTSCDFEFNGITAIGNEGKSFKYKIPILELFEIPWSILCDRDTWDAKIKGNTIINFLEKTNLHSRKPRVFLKLKKYHEDKIGLNVKVIDSLSKFNIYCLNGCLEDFVITESNKEKVQKILENLFPEKFKEAKTNREVIDERFLQTILLKEKSIWAKPIATELEPEEIHSEIEKNINLIFKRIN